MRYFLVIFTLLLGTSFAQITCPRDNTWVPRVIGDLKLLPSLEDATPEQLEAVSHFLLETQNQDTQNIRQSILEGFSQEFSRMYQNDENKKQTFINNTLNLGLGALMYTVVACGRGLVKHGYKTYYGRVVSLIFATAFVVYYEKYMFRLLNPTRSKAFHETTGRMLFLEFNNLVMMASGAAGAKWLGLNKVAINLLEKKGVRTYPDFDKPIQDLVKGLNEPPQPSSPQTFKIRKDWTKAPLDTSPRSGGAATIAQPNTQKATSVGKAFALMPSKSIVSSNVTPLNVDRPPSKLPSLKLIPIESNLEEKKLSSTSQTSTQHIIPEVNNSDEEPSLEKVWKGIQPEKFKTFWELVQEALNGKISLRHTVALKQAKKICEDYDLKDNLCSKISELLSKKEEKEDYTGRSEKQTLLHLFFISLIKDIEVLHKTFNFIKQGVSESNIPDHELKENIEQIVKIKKEILPETEAKTLQVFSKNINDRIVGYYYILNLEKDYSSKTFLFKILSDKNKYALIRYFQKHVLNKKVESNKIFLIKDIKNLESNPYLQHKEHVFSLTDDALRCIGRWVTLDKELITKINTIESVKEDLKDIMGDFLKDISEQFSKEDLSEVDDFLIEDIQNIISESEASKKRHPYHQFYRLRNRFLEFKPKLEQFMKTEKQMKELKDLENWFKNKHMALIKNIESEKNHNSSNN